MERSLKPQGHGETGALEQIGGEGGIALERTPAEIGQRRIFDRLRIGREHSGPRPGGGTARRVAFEDRHLRTALAQFERRRETDQPRADDRDVGNHRPV